MTTSRWTFAGLALLLAATGPGSTITRADSGPYAVQELGLPGQDSVALAVNSEGVTVGYSSPDGFVRTPFRQAPGAGPEILPDGGGGNATATGITEAGQVALFGSIGGTFRPFRLEPGASSVTELDAAATLVQTYAIDASGRVVGFSFDGAVVRAVRWNGSGTEPLPTPAGFSAATATSDNGELVAGFAGLDAFKWTAGGGYAALPSLGTSAAALGANDAGDVVGYSLVGGSFVGTLWPASGGAPVALDGLTQAEDINAHGQIVGYVATAGGDRAVLWHSGATVDLTSLLPAGSGWTLARAHGINDAGQIVGEGIYNGQRRGFLLTPPVLSDTTPPVISSVAASPDAIWPPNHNMVPVSVRVSATDDSGETPVCAVTGVTSSDPEDASGDGSTSRDTAVVGPLAVKVRAERSSPSDARVYTIAVECRDGSNNASTSSGFVRVGELSTLQKSALKKTKGRK